MDFRNFTSSEQFDKNKIYHIIRLESLPGFKILDSEREYLLKYRECIMKESGQDPIPDEGITNAQATVVQPHIETDPEKIEKVHIFEEDPNLISEPEETKTEVKIKKKKCTKRTSSK